MYRRSMEFAGSWYPAKAADCLKQMQAWDRSTPRGPHVPAAGTRCCVVPHAGWMYSGRLAHHGIQLMAGSAAETIKLVILLGGHLHRDDPVITMTEGEWETPFGTMTIHPGFEAQLAGLPEVVRETSLRNDPDNSIEVVLPFVRRVFPNAALLPFRVPPSEVALELGHRLAAFLAHQGVPAVAIASTDLTHYGPNYGFEPRGRGPDAEQWVREVNDPLFLKAVRSGSGSAILDSARRQRNACCPGAVATLNEIVRAHPDSLAFHSLEYATSLDIAREMEPGTLSPNFVGYVAGVYA